MLREILNAKDSRLRVTSKPVKKIDKKITTLIKDLKDTLVVQKDPEGVGLAAPQIGKNVRVFVMMPEKDIKVVINPQIVSLENIKGRKAKPEKKAKKIMEGCLSLPHFYGPISRIKKVVIKYLDEEGKQIKETFEGMGAQIIQHEIDHLNGILFIDRLFEQKKPLYEYKDGEWEKVDLPL